MMNRFEHLPALQTRKTWRWQKYGFDSALAIAGALLVTYLIYWLNLYPRIHDISFAYLLIVLALAVMRGLYASILTSIVAFLSFDFFIVPPLYTFTIAHFEEWLALFFFLTVAIITAKLASDLSQRAEQANRRERETRILYELLRATNGEEDLHRQLKIVALAIVEIFSLWGVQGCAVLIPDANGKVRLEAGDSPSSLQLTPDEETMAALVMKQAQAVDIHDVALAPQVNPGFAPRAVIRSTRYSIRRYKRMLPLKLGQQVVGVVCLVMEDDPRLFAVEQSLGAAEERTDPHSAFFSTFLNQSASIIERARLRQETLQVELLRQTDALRAALLSSVSHDLRTPLASIKAAASSLLQEDVQWDEEARRSFAQAIEKEADRLNRLVANLLDMSRIEGGALKPEKEWYPIDELIHDVLDHMQSVLHERTVQTLLPDTLPPVEIDYLEMDQVLTNLIENAVRYTPDTSPIEISAQYDGKEVMISVADRGPGIPAGDRERVFDKFYRISSTLRQTALPAGSGLGLAVCKGLVEAHGGRIWVENREGGGAIFRFTLPVSNMGEMDETHE